VVFVSTFTFFQSTRDKTERLNSQTSTTSSISSQKIISSITSSSNQITSQANLASSSSKTKSMANFKLTDLSDDSIKKVALDNITQDPNTGSFMKDCLSKTTVEPIFKKEIIYSKTL